MSKYELSPEYQIPQSPTDADTKIQWANNRTYLLTFDHKGVLQQ